MKDKHAKDAEQDVAKNVTQGVAEDVLGAVEDEGVKVLMCPSSSSSGVTHAHIYRRVKRPLNVRKPLLVRQAR